MNPKTLALAYIQIILSITNNNKQLTLTLFKKLFEELPLQIIDIKDALKKNNTILPMKSHTNSMVRQAFVD